MRVLFLNQSRAIVILSCDKYSDLWYPIVSNLKSRFLETAYPIYLVSNQIDFTADGVINIQSGFDIDWSTSFKRALNQIPENELLILLDDMPLRKTVSGKELEEAFNLLSTNDLGALHPRPIPPKRHWNKDHESWYQYSNQDSYTSNVYSIWKKEILQNILIEGESPWEFEVFGSNRLNAIATSGALKKNLLDYSNLVIKGMWHPEIKSVQAELGLKLNLAKRKQTSKLNSKQIISVWIFKIVQNLFPQKLQRILFSFFRKIG